MGTHRYIGPNLNMGTDPTHHDPLRHGEVGSLTATKRGGLRSFQRDRDRRGFWVPPTQLRPLARERVDE